MAKGPMTAPATHARSGWLPDSVPPTVVVAVAAEVVVAVSSVVSEPESAARTHVGPELDGAGLRMQFAYPYAMEGS